MAIKRNSRNRGSVLLVCIGLLVVMAVMAAGFISAISSERTSASGTGVAEMANMVALTGMEQTIALLVAQETAALNTTPTHQFGPSLDGSGFSTDQYCLDYIERYPSSSKVTLPSRFDLVINPFYFQYYTNGMTGPPTAGYFGADSANSNMSDPPYYSYYGIEASLYRTASAGYAYYITQDILKDQWKTKDASGRYKLRYAVAIQDLSGSMCGIKPSSGIELKATTLQYSGYSSSQFWTNVKGPTGSSYTDWQTSTRESAYQAAGGLTPSFRTFLKASGLTLADTNSMKFMMLASPFQRECRVNILTAPPAVIGPMLIGFFPHYYKGGSGTTNVFATAHASATYGAAIYNLGTSQEGAAASYSLLETVFPFKCYPGGPDRYPVHTTLDLTINTVNGNDAKKYYNELLKGMLKTIQAWRNYDIGLGGKKTSHFVADFKANILKPVNPGADPMDKAREKLKEIILNDFLISWFGEGTDNFDVDNGVEHTLGTGDTLTGRFYVGKSQYFRIMVRGEVFDTTTGKVLGESNVESVYYIHYNDPENKGTYDASKSHKVYQRFVQNQYTTGKFN